MSGTLQMARSSASSLKYSGSLPKSNSRNCWADIGVPSGCQKVVHVRGSPGSDRFAIYFSPGLRHECHDRVGEWLAAKGSASPRRSGTKGTIAGSLVGRWAGDPLAIECRASGCRPRPPDLARGGSARDNSCAAIVLMGYPGLKGSSGPPGRSIHVSWPRMRQDWRVEHGGGDPWPSHRPEEPDLSTGAA